MNNPKILLYVVFHNHWDYIEESIASIRENLKTINFDVLIVNTTESKSDNDRLKKIINDFRIINISKKLPYVIHQVYEEYLNEYEFIMRLDADDFLYPGSVKILFDSINKSNEYGAVYGSWSVVDKNSRKVRVISPPMEDAGLGFHGACTLFRTHSLKGLNFSDMSIDSQDGYATFLFFKLNQVKVVMTNEVIFGYRRHESNISSNLDHLRQNRQKILDFFYKRIPLSERNLFNIVLIDTDLEDLFESDHQFIKDLGYILVRDGIAVVEDRILDIPKNQTLIDFFVQLKDDGNFVFINTKKLGSSYNEGLLVSFLQYASIMRPKIATYVEPITNRVLVVNNDGKVSAINVEGNENTFCFTEFNGLHAIMNTMHVREHAMYSYEILNKIVNYEF
tara:strand:- start:21225 stop:22403 length:1179 start_codon:yes stop_codon:yes gene_type:complete